MKTIVTLFFDVGKIPGQAEAILLPAGCGPDVAHVSGGIYFASQDGSDWYEPLFVHVELEEGDERIAKLHALLAPHDVKVDISRRIEYSEEDYQNAVLLKMSSGSENLQCRALELGTKYDTTHACPRCGTGTKQVWFERVKRKELKRLQKHRAIMTLDSHIIVDPVMRQMLVDGGITGISFADVFMRDEVGDWNPIDYHQVLIESTLPAMRGELTADEETEICPVCRRGGFSYYSNKRYHKDDLTDIKDFNFTWEWFGRFRFDGNVRTSDLSFPRILVTPKVRDILCKAGEKETFRWKPVTIEP
ncbi:MAG TPA: hypothetical protein PK156_35915 [Polyangium sp.]|nr:hypothetical protein [Polyangium sp.]